MRLPVQTLPESWAKYARERAPRLDPRAIWEDFRDYWKAVPGAKGLKCDWDATWQTWVRKEASKAGPVAGASMPPPTRPPTASPELPPPPTDAEKDAARAIYGKTLTRIKGYAGGDSWARRILDRHAAGERLLPQQLQAARMALRENHETAADQEKKVPIGAGRDDVALVLLDECENEAARELRIEREAIQSEGA